MTLPGETDPHEADPHEADPHEADLQRYNAATAHLERPLAVVDLWALRANAGT